MPLRFHLEYYAVVAVRALVGALPWRLSSAVGSAVGLAFYGLDRAHRRLTLANLAAAFPRRPEAERRAIARQVFAHFGRLLVEMLRFSRLSPDDMRAACDFEGLERLEQAQGRGVIFITGHFGYWEVHALVHGLLGRPISVVARALDNPRLHDLLERMRTVTGNTVIYRQRGVRRILKALVANEGVAILIDQHIQAADAVTVDFFDRPASTTVAVAALALKTGALVVPVFALPLGNGRYRLIYEHPVQPPPADSPDAVREFTQRCTDVLEMYVRRYPHFWLWMHRRWRDVEHPAAPGMFPTVGARG